MADVTHLGNIKLLLYHAWLSIADLSVIVSKFNGHSCHMVNDKHFELTTCSGGTHLCIRTACGFAGNVACGFRIMIYSSQF